MQHGEHLEIHLRPFSSYVYSIAPALGGFLSSTAVEAVAQPISAITEPLLGVTVVPAVLRTVAIGFQARCRLDAQRG